MDKFLIKGPCKIKGKVFISGSKNSSLPILAATLLFDKTVTIKNLPRVKDIDTMLNLLKSLGSKVEISKNKKTVKISKTKYQKIFAPYSLMKTMRAGILVLGPLLARFRKAQCSMPGGCNLGLRPIDIHLKALTKLGVNYKIIKGYVHAKADNGILGTEIKFPKISVGATENFVLDVDMQEMQHGDRYLLCSDGLTKHIPDVDFEKMLTKGDVEKKCNELIDLTLARGAKDNVTAILIDIE